MSVKKMAVDFEFKTWRQSQLKFGSVRQINIAWGMLQLMTFEKFAFKQKICFLIKQDEKS